MAELDKVIKALEFCIMSEDCRPCVYWQTFDNTGCQAMKDALELLKEQAKLIEDKQDMIEILEDHVSMLQERD